VGKKGNSKKGKKGKDGATGSGRSGSDPALDPPTVGLLIAAVVAGPPLYTLYQGGDIALSTVLVHGGLVAAGCAFGVSLVNRLIADYRAQADRERRIQEMMDSLEDVVHEGLPIQGILHPTAGHPTGPPTPGEQPAPGSPTATGPSPVRPGAPAGSTGPGVGAASTGGADGAGTSTGTS
jgi:hypothetical protein